MDPAQSHLLPDGRLHLHHGPIDLIIGVTCDDAQATFQLATKRFATLLNELVAELAALRQPTVPETLFQSSIAHRMQAATLPLLPAFITPMAAVAGAVADEILATLTADKTLQKAHVNNGGDVAIYLTPGHSLTTAIAGTPATLTIRHDLPFRGIATSGWRGRSQSLGIADSVTVLARTAASADAAATLIGNTVDLPGHPAITRQPADTLKPDSDLGARLVTTHVGPLTHKDRDTALNNGARYAAQLARLGLIDGAYLTLQGASRQTGALHSLPQPEPLNA